MGGDSTCGHISADLLNDESHPARAARRPFPISPRFYTPGLPGHMSPHSALDTCPVRHPPRARTFFLISTIGDVRRDKAILGMMPCGAWVLNP